MIKKLIKSVCSKNFAHMVFQVDIYIYLTHIQHMNAADVNIGYTELLETTSNYIDTIQFCI